MLEGFNFFFAKGTESIILNLKSLSFVNTILFSILYWNSLDFVSRATLKARVYICFQSVDNSGYLLINFSWAEGGVCFLILKLLYISL